MSELYRIVVDTKGADKGPAVIVGGVKAALDMHKNLAVLLAGDSEVILSECERLGADMSRIEILEAPEGVTNYDSPAAALFEKPNSSLVLGMTALRDRDDLCGFVGAGNTGALIAGSMKFLAGANRVRPALAAVLPAESGGFTCLVDTGATVDCDAGTLHHFARLGTDFMKKMYGIESPRVGLLSNGAEETKGNKVVKEAHARIKEDAALNFIGNVEGNKALSGACDVLVCDGFAGNQVLKVTEGTARRMLTDIVKYAKKTGSEEAMKIFGYLMQTYDIASLGGGIILGAVKPVIKAHGACDEKAIVSTVTMVLNMAQSKKIYDENHAE